MTVFPLILLSRRGGVFLHSLARRAAGELLSSLWLQATGAI
jgi:hypothetical protein